ncbi:hypothetical protein JKP88DRAFT_251507 [Tribonema minus]|uniref:Uncharacterized protein n=1 Tax=Tribonema minus TaxID=303371 RepID=A0A835ZD56_9STRA|nr:hypothetical protein JKP88DRAFT_251507 [Tribonema minus]
MDTATPPAAAPPLVPAFTAIWLFDAAAAAPAAGAAAAATDAVDSRAAPPPPSLRARRASAAALRLSCTLLAAARPRRMSPAAGLGGLTRVALDTRGAATVAVAGAG